MIRQPIEIVGGGLAGLALGLALRRRHVPVTIIEAGRYPRSKVCGEFITGLDQATISTLQLEPWLAPQRRHRNATWHFRSGRVVRQRLPAAAIAVSRYWLDTQLADAFRQAGGDLRERTRVGQPEPRAGQVWAAGRGRERGGWTGLKVHLEGMPLDGDLEMHLGDGAYVGLTPVEGGRVNVCGLFRPERVTGGAADDVLARCLRAAGLETLARRIDKSTTIPGSQAAVAGARFGRLDRDPDRLAIGDAFAAIAPFTGHGMAMALQSAAECVEPLVRWNDSAPDWPEVVQHVRRRLRRRFALRIAAAQSLHPLLVAPRTQSLMAHLLARRLLPMRALYHVLH